MAKPPKVGVFLFNGYQELEFWYPVLRLREAGADVVVIGIAGAEAATSQLGYPVVPNVALAQCAPREFDALVLPGGKTAELSENAALGRFIDEAAANGAVLAAASQAASLVPRGKNALVARTTDDVPQWTRSLLNSLQRT